MASPTQWTWGWASSRRWWWEAWCAAVCGLPKNWTWLSDLITTRFKVRKHRKSLGKGIDKILAKIKRSDYFCADSRESFRIVSQFLKSLNNLWHILIKREMSYFTVLSKMALFYVLSCHNNWNYILDFVISLSFPRYRKLEVKPWVINQIISFPLLFWFKTQ